VKGILLVCGRVLAVRLALTLAFLAGRAFLRLGLLAGVWLPRLRLCGVRLLRFRLCRVRLIRIRVIGLRELLVRRRQDRRRRPGDGR
jgi:hypothetical protein